MLRAEGPCPRVLGDLFAWARPLRGLSHPMICCAAPPLRSDGILAPTRQELPGRAPRYMSRETLRGSSARMGKREESAMPMIFFLWAIPAVIVIGGGTYYLMHMH